MIMVADAVAGGEVHIAALCAELDQFYGDLPAGTPAERAAQVRDVLFGSPPLAYALVARDGQAPAGLAAYSFLWPAAGLSASLYLKELYVAEAYRRDRRRAHAHGRAGAVASRRGLSRVEWTTDTSNEGAQAFYESLGAKPLTAKIFHRTTPRDLPPVI